MARFHCPAPLQTGLILDLPEGAARHVQVLRLQPGDAVTLFNGEAVGALTGEFAATVTQMGRSRVQVVVGDFAAVSREAPREVHLVVGMPANDRMDWLIEKATELGVSSVLPVMTERSVLRLSGERAEKKVVHWRSVAVSASEQCGGNRVPLIHPVHTLPSYLAVPDASGALRLLLSLQTDSTSLHQRISQVSMQCPVLLLSGPEGGLSPAEESLARTAGFQAVTLGPRVLRAETAALAALASLLVR
jgi:16S rRNA (uracil1498-N3)-methyltransferase